ncbi:hypothetical protein KSS87_013680 [Heliosperma pusillum]|nr:hypothetical protein KSS87_013680 [Heliosperma pusillum]
MREKNPINSFLTSFLLIISLLAVATSTANDSQIQCSKKCIALNCDSMTSVKCHEKFKRCIKKVQKSGKAGFTKDCPYDVAVPTMVQGMDLAIMMSQLAGPKLEL